MQLKSLWIKLVCSKYLHTTLNKFIIFHIPKQCGSTGAQCAQCRAFDSSALTTANCTDNKSLIIEHEVKKSNKHKKRLNQAMIHLQFAIVLPTKVWANHFLCIYYYTEIRNNEKKVRTISYGELETGRKAISCCVFFLFISKLRLYNDIHGEGHKLANWLSALWAGCSIESRHGANIMQICAQFKRNICWKDEGNNDATQKIKSHLSMLLWRDMHSTSFYLRNKNRLCANVHIAELNGFDLLKDFHCIL